MLDVFITFDTEIWCNGWRDLDAQFPAAFRRYVYGPTRRGDGAIPLLIKHLNDAGLTGVFFTEPLFSTRFGLDPLAELVGLLHDGGQEIQAHLHPEWADETVPPLLPTLARKTPNLAQFGLAEQIELIGIGLTQLRAAGAGDVRAFRAGNYACNADTPAALHANDIFIDSSYNAASPWGREFEPGGRIPRQAFDAGGITVYPVSVFADGMSDHPRHLQLTSCSWGEIEHALWQALDLGWESLVIVSHNFELMNTAKTRIDPIAVRRFRKLCAFLDRHRDRFNATGFNAIEPRPFPGDAAPLRSHAGRTLWRLGEQLVRRAYGA